MEFLRDLFLFLGRILIGGVFLWSAVDKIQNWHTTLAHLKTKNIPYLNLILPLSLVLKVVGSLWVILGWHAHLGALLLLIVAIPSLLKLHSFWNENVNERAMQRKLFMVELAVIGGLFLILAIGSGPWGFSGR